MTTDCITYHINDENKVVYISENWQSFAVENMAGILNAENVLKKSIFDFVADDNTRHLYHMLFERVRSTPVSIEFPFRCDSPDRRRYMAMEIFPLQDGLIALKSCTVREELREAVLLLDPRTERTDEYLTICGWCKKVYVNEEWVEVESAMELLHLLGENKLPNLSHGMCDDCYERINQQLNPVKKSLN